MLALKHRLWSSHDGAHGNWWLPNWLAHHHSAWLAVLGLQAAVVRLHTAKLGLHARRLTVLLVLHRKLRRRSMRALHELRLHKMRRRNMILELPVRLLMLLSHIHELHHDPRDRSHATTD